ncbi:MAG: hypothetical protein DWQ35_04600 [Planctomycetota bacterium]|mgnify:CR=1 FL=1|nr:MAG: hypothetical protein DWQ35_04600 [Planctomycetota bacterium]REK25123.1 MAG: hypothetical protein DWQ42_12190 [Planctomycetota bacterium]REK40515.1 MAG: hypothetical protein DWQ46_16120 [Planctomycetota bacterium]
MTEHESSATSRSVEPTRARGWEDGELPLNQREQIDLERRLAYLGLSEEDATRLRSLMETFSQTEDAFVNAFYQHLDSFEETAQFLHEPELVARLRDLQREHFASLLTAEWNEEYVAERIRVGRTHARVGLGPQWFLGGYGQYVQHVFRTMSEHHGPDTREAAETCLSLMKVIFLDIGLTLDAYFEHSTDKLRTALDLYWRANDDLRRFAQLASHDLKTPIATVANLCDETLDEFGEEMPEAARELIRSARDRIFKTSTMIDELLQSTLRAHAEEKPDTIDLNELVGDVVDRIKVDLERKQIEVAVPASLPHICGDRARLREAFYNLLSNAAKFIDKKPGKIEIDAEENGPQCLVSIRDNGPGIPEAELQRVFVPFHRLAAHRDRPGSGLGLYFTMYLIDREGGKIWAESKVGEGSRFCVLLNRPREGFAVVE